MTPAAARRRAASTKGVMEKLLAQLHRTELVEWKRLEKLG